jgi:hypothetical protein
MNLHELDEEHGPGARPGHLAAVDAVRVEDESASRKTRLIAATSHRPTLSTTQRTH